MELSKHNYSENSKTFLVDLAAHLNYLNTCLEGDFLCFISNNNSILNEKKRKLKL